MAITVSAHCHNYYITKTNTVSTLPDEIIIILTVSEDSHYN